MITEKTTEDDGKKDESLVKYYLSEVNGALKREKGWRKAARTAVKIYEAEEAKENSYNILYTNTDTLLPSLYNSTPRPEVRRRYDDEDPLGLLACSVVERSLAYLLDTDLNDTESFDSAMENAVLAGLTAGRGQVWVKYDATLAQKPLTLTPEPASEEASAEGEPREGLEQETPTYEAVEGETILTETIPWDRFLHGYGKKWSDVPWVGRIHVMDKDELIDNFGQEVAAVCELTAASESDDEEDQNDAKERATTERKFATVFEIWDKRKKKVIFVSQSCPEKPLKIVDDPLALSGFFPCPRPLLLVKKVSTLTPTTLYAMYEEQAKELNRVSSRINRITLALKVRGLYDSTISGIDKVLEADDNQLIPADNISSLQQGQTLEKSLWLMPLDKLITVLQQLYTQRQQVKQVIFEITGIADIMRGSSAASETLGAQQIKNQWGTLRLKKAQREVQRFARDTLRLMAEVAVTKLSPETLQKMTSIPIPLAAEKEQATAIMQQIQSQPQPPQVPGQPPEQGPQVPPEVEAAASSPSWDDILALLQDDVQRSYRIDIETDSTIDLEATEDKKDMGELMNALAQFFNGIAPMVQQGTLPFEAAKAMLLGMVRKFRFGNEVEQALQKMQAPQAQGAQQPDPAVEAAKAKAQNDIEVARMELEFKKEEMSMKLEELQMKRQLMRAKMQMQLQTALTPKPAPVAKSTGVTN